MGLICSFRQTRESAFRNVKSVSEVLADEIINASKGSSNSYAIKKKEYVPKSRSPNLERKLILLSFSVSWSESPSLTDKVSLLEGEQVALARNAYFFLVFSSTRHQPSTVLLRPGCIGMMWWEDSIVRAATRTSELFCATRRFLVGSQSFRREPTTAVLLLSPRIAFELPDLASGNPRSPLFSSFERFRCDSGSQLAESHAASSLRSTASSTMSCNPKYEPAKK